MGVLNFHRERCTLCGQCVEQCPFGALELKDGRVELNASCKMCRLCVKNCPAEAITYVEEEEKESVDKDKWRGILVFAEQEASGIHPVALELIGKARELAGKINHPLYVILIGSEKATEQAEELLYYGIDRVHVYAHKELAHFRGDVYTAVMEDCIRKVRPSVVLVGATSLGRSLAPACATRFRTGLTADCTMLDIKENTDLVQIRPAFGGNIMAQIVTTHTRPQFATVRYKVMDVAKRQERFGEIIYETVTQEMLKSGMEVIGTETVNREKGIEEEEILVVGGRGLKKQEDLKLLEELAKALGGQVATTRPLVEKGWNDVTRQIGLSGRTVKPKLIITCGVSGAVQFAAGMDNSQCIVAINTDPEAGIFKVANYGIVGDLYEIVPKLTQAVRERKQ